MVFPPVDGGIFGKPGESEPFIVPMAIPGVAGPSAMAALLLLGSNQPGRLGAWAIALFLAWLATAAILLSATYLFRWLGESVLTALERLMGMVLIAISVQMFLAGMAAYFHASGF
jgi:small neutral amino acid transporter SnatA (MarC family)